MRVSIAAAFLLLVMPGSLYAAEFETPLAFVNGNVVTAPETSSKTEPSSSKTAASPPWANR